MRPDTRSFSFTWLRGGQHEEELSLGRPTTRSQTVARNSGYGKIGTNQSTPEGVQKVLAQQKSAASKRNLRRLGSSFLQNITNNGTKPGDSNAKYDFIIEDKDVEMEGENNAQLENRESSTSTKSISIGKRLNKTVQDVKSTLESMSQRFRRTTARRYRMKIESPSTPATATRRILGRTPTKLYSPFGFDTPPQKTPKRLGAERATTTPRLCVAAESKTSVSGSDDTDVKNLRRGFHKLQCISRGIPRRSVRF